MFNVLLTVLSPKVPERKLAVNGPTLLPAGYHSMQKKSTGSPTKEPLPLRLVSAPPRPQRYLFRSDSHGATEPPRGRKTVGPRRRGETSFALLTHAPTAPAALSRPRRGRMMFRPYPLDRHPHSLHGANSARVSALLLGYTLAGFRGSC